MQLSEVVLRPVITEQSVAGLDEKKYTFEVDRRANKTHIKQAVEAMFEGVKVKNNNFLNYWNLSWKKIIFQEFQ